MKKHISLLTCFATVFMLASCSEWLDVKPSTQLDRKELLSSEKGYAEAVKGVYSQMCEKALYGQEMTWGTMDVLAGNYSTFPASYNGLKSYSYVPGTTDQSAPAIALMDNIWNGMYNAIAGLNSVLGQIDRDKALFTEDNYSILKGEAMGLRAFLHLDLLRMYADVYENSKNTDAIPYVVKLTMLVTPFLTGEEAVNTIIADLKEAVVLLANDPMCLGTTPSPILASIPATNSASAASNIFPWHNRRFHFNYYAAKATLARAYLWKGEKALALATAQELIAAQATRFPWVLTSNLTSIDNGATENQDRTFATEHIFAINVTDIENLSAGFLIDLPASPGTEAGMLLSMRDMFSVDEQGADPRYKYMYTMYAANAPLLSKFYQRARVSAYFKYRLPLIRISEMYYIAAECTDDVQQGITYLETVRKQRGMGSMPLSGVTTKAALQNEIYREYRKEFIGEGQLWFYYKRQKSATIANMTFNKGQKAYTFPIPENEELYGNRK